MLPAGADLPRSALLAAASGRPTERQLLAPSVASVSNKGSAGSSLTAAPKKASASGAESNAAATPPALLRGPLYFHSEVSLELWLSGGAPAASALSGHSKAASRKRSSALTPADNAAAAGIVHIVPLNRTPSTDLSINQLYSITGSADRRSKLDNCAYDDFVAEKPSTTILKEYSCRLDFPQDFTAFDGAAEVSLLSSNIDPITGMRRVKAKLNFRPTRIARHAKL